MSNGKCDRCDRPLDSDYTLVDCWKNGSLTTYSTCKNCYDRVVKFLETKPSDPDKLIPAYLNDI